MDTADSPPRPSTSGSGGPAESDADGADRETARPVPETASSTEPARAAGSKTPTSPTTSPAGRPTTQQQKPSKAPGSTTPGSTAPGSKAPGSKAPGSPSASGTAAKTSSTAPAPGATTPTAPPAPTRPAPPASPPNGATGVRGSGAAPVAVAATAAPVVPGQTAPQPVTTTPVAEAPPRSAPPPAIRPVGPRRARLLVTRLDPWSVMKTAFMLSVSVAVVLLVATALLWWTLDVTGVFDTIGRTVDDVAGSSSSSFDFLSLVSFSRVMGVALVLSAIEIVLVSALTTLFAFLYNLSVGLTGGLEVTLSEDA